MTAKKNVLMSRVFDIITQKAYCIGKLKSVKREREKLRNSTLLFSILLNAVILLPIFLIIWTSSIDKENSIPEIFVGLEYAINNESIEDAEALVDRVKNFTNLFIVDSLGITLDINNLDEVGGYINIAGLYFLVFFISPINETTQWRYNYYPLIWISEAKEKYGNRFLGTYVFDEPGGNQLDQGNFVMLKAEDPKDETEADKIYIENLGIHIEYYTAILKSVDVTALTADYGLYWFDYKTGYDCVLVEYARNHSRQLHTALCRGAAKVQNGNWGVMVTWTYNDVPYIVSGSELYDDLILAYHDGAKYAVVFDYPETEYLKYRILTEEHFDALQEFWDYVNNNPRQHGTIKAEVVYVLRENYGFGFVSADDNIWGLWSANTDDQSEKIWRDINLLINEYGFSLNIVYRDPEFNADLQRYYERVILTKHRTEE